MTDMAEGRPGLGVLSAPQYARIKGLFVELCDLPDAERAARLEQIEDGTRGGIFGAADAGQGSLARV
jgi:hypothetical protein